MASLVADYSSDTESSYGSDSSDVKAEKDGVNHPKPTLGLPKPDFKTADGSSVFLNPFIEADNAKKAILEKHVKMISTDVKMVNGKKICWNYKKNKCRFGHKCKYAHDSDVQLDALKDNSESAEHDMKISNLVQASSKQIANITKLKRKSASIDSSLPRHKVIKTFRKQDK